MGEGVETQMTLDRRIMKLRLLSVAMLLGIFAAIAVPAALGAHYVYALRGLWEVAVISIYVVVAAVISQWFATAYFHDGLRKLEKDIREQGGKWGGGKH